MIGMRVAVPCLVHSIPPHRTTPCLPPSLRVVHELYVCAVRVVRRPDLPTPAMWACAWGRVLRDRVLGRGGSPWRVCGLGPLGLGGLGLATQVPRAVCRTAPQSAPLRAGWLCPCHSRG